MKLKTQQKHFLLLKQSIKESDKNATRECITNIIHKLTVNNKCIKSKVSDFTSKERFRICHEY